MKKNKEKNMKKVVSFGMSLLMGCSAVVGFASCGGDDEKTLEIAALNLGYGTQWLHDLAEAYKAKHSDVEIIIDDNYSGTDDTTLTDELESGVTDYDIFFVRDAMYKYMQTSKSINGTNYDCLLEDLSSFYTGVNPYDSQYTVKTKIKQDILEQISIEKNGVKKQYTLPWVSSTLGILYNASIFETLEVSVPNTTDELLQLCATIKGNTGNYVPFIDSLGASYITSLLQVWFTQYEGLETADAFWNGYDPQGGRNTVKIFEYTGILEAYKVLYEILCADNGYMHSNIDLSFTDAQNYILDESYKVAMMPNGDWILREMEDNYERDEVNVKFMKTPIISSIKNTFADATDKTMTDAKLSEIITKIDNNVAYSFSEYGCQEATYDKIKEARSGVASYSNGHVAYIPVYSAQKDLAKDFLYYMVSDEGLEIFTKATNGSTQPYTFDYENCAGLEGKMNEFSLNAYHTFNNSTILPYEYNKYKLFCLGGVCLDDWQYSFVLPFRAETTDSIHQTAEEFFLGHKAFYESNNNWAKCLNKAALREE